MDADGGPDTASTLRLQESNARRLEELAMQSFMTPTPRGRPPMVPASASAAQTGTAPMKRTRETPGSVEDEAADENVEPSRSQPRTGSRPAIFSLFGNRRATKERPNIQAVVVDAHELLWSNSLGAKASSDITPEERARQETIHELLKTEVTYLDSLREIDAFYNRPLHLCKFISVKEADTIFANFDEILHLHKEFLEVVDGGRARPLRAQALERRQREERPVIVNIGDLLLSFAAKAKVYVAYGSNLSRMQAEVQRLLAANREFVGFLDSLATRKRIEGTVLYLNLREDLIRPTTRLQKYALLYRSILVATPEGHTDHAAMKEAVQAMVGLVSELNERKRAIENADRLRALQGAIDFSQVAEPVTLAPTPTATLVREGTVMQLVVSKEHKIKTRKPLRLIVAADVLYVCIDAATDKDFHGKPHRLILPPAKLAHVSASDLPDREHDGQQSHIFEIKILEPAPELLICQAGTAEDKAAWVALFDAKKSAPEPAQRAKRVAAEAPVAAADGDAPAEPAKSVVLTDVQMGLSDNEQKLMRTAAAAKVLGPNGWEKLGKGELMLVYNAVKGHSRIIFFAEASTARVYNAADINAWLFKGMKNEKFQEKSINVALFEGAKLQSYVLQLSSSKERDLLWELFDKYQHPNGEKSEAAATPAHAAAPAATAPTAGAEAQVAELQQRVEQLQAALDASEAQVAALEKRREYEAKVVERLWAKNRATIEQLQAEVAALKGVPVDAVAVVHDEGIPSRGGEAAALASDSAL